MTKYRIKEGVTRINVCGESLLVTTGTTFEVPCYIRQLNKEGAGFWDIINAEPDREAQMNLITAEYGCSLKEAGEALDYFWNQLFEGGFAEKIPDKK